MYAFELHTYCKETESSVSTQIKWVYFHFVYFLSGDQTVNFIPVCTWLTYTDCNYSTGVGQLERSMCSCIMKPDCPETI